VTIIRRTVEPQTNADRLAEWYAKAVRIGYVLTGPRQIPPSVTAPANALPCVPASDGVVVRIRRKRA
jgi:hypothetical protein